MSSVNALVIFPPGFVIAVEGCRLCSRVHFGAGSLVLDHCCRSYSNHGFVDPVRWHRSSGEASASRIGVGYVPHQPMKT